MYQSAGALRFGRQLRAINAVVREVTDPGLPDNYIGSLFEDQHGRIWASTSKGVAWFEKGRFTRVSGMPAGSANAIFANKHEGVRISYPGHGCLMRSEGEWSNRCLGRG